MNLAQLTKMNEDQAREYLESVRWPDGPVCPHCESKNAVKLQGASTRPGVHKCRDCRKQFTVTVNTVMSDSHITIRNWIIAFHLIASSKKGFSAHQLHRTLGVTYKSAWHLFHRIRHAMTLEPLAGVLGGDGRIVEVDEAYIGGKPRKYSGEIVKRGRGTKKAPVVALVERGGKARARVMERPTGPEIKAYMRRNIKRESLIMTDESKLYTGTQALFQGHETVNHSQFEYKRGNASTNEVEAFFALIKRAHYGTHHHYSKAHIDSYITEAAFKWNTRKIDCVERTKAAIAGARGKRLTYRRTD